MDLSMLDWNLLMRLANNALGRENPKYSWQYFTVSILLVVNNLIKKSVNDKVDGL